MKPIFVAIGLLMFGFSFCGQAEETVKQDEPASEQKICKTERVTGSNLPRRVCATAAERAAQRQAAQQALSSATRRTSAIGGGK